jgi:type I restriction enzyme S subunit
MKLTFDEAFTVGKTAGNAVKQKDYLPEGKFPVIDQGEDFISGYSDDESLVLDFTKPVIIFGDHTRRLKYVNFPFIPGADGTKILVQSDSIDSKFAYYQLQSKDLRDKGYARHFSELRKEEFWVPPIDEQHKIVELLEDHLSRLDGALADVKQAKIRAAQFRASVLNSIFFDSGCKGWSLYKAANLGKWVTGSTPSSKVPDFVGNDVPFVTPGDVFDGGEIIQYSRMISSSGADAVRRLRSNSVHLVCIGATLGKVGIARFETTSNQQINALEADEKVVRPDFVMWVLASPAMQRKLWEASSSTTVPILNKGNLEKIDFRIPDLSQQKKALEEFDHVKLTYERVNHDIENMLEKSKSLRRSLLRAAFTGQLTKEAVSV